MSRNIQIRDVPDDIHAELRRQAAESGLSLSEFLRREVVSIAGRSRNARIMLRLAARDDVPVERDDVVRAIADARQERARR